jgi:hypothetical protein
MTLFAIDEATLPAARFGRAPFDSGSRESGRSACICRMDCRDGTGKIAPELVTAYRAAGSGRLPMTRRAYIPIART